MMGWMAPLRHLGAKLLADGESAANREPSMSQITTIGLGPVVIYRIRKSAEA